MIHPHDARWTFGLDIVKLAIKQVRQPSTRRTLSMRQSSASLDTAKAPQAKESIWVIASKGCTIPDNADAIKLGNKFEQNWRKGRIRNYCMIPTCTHWNAHIKPYTGLFLTELAVIAMFILGSEMKVGRATSVEIVPTTALPESARTDRAWRPAPRRAQRRHRGS